MVFSLFDSRSLALNLPITLEIVSWEALVAHSKRTSAFEDVFSHWSHFFLDATKSPLHRSELSIKGRVDKQCSLDGTAASLIY